MSNLWTLPKFIWRKGCFQTCHANKSIHETRDKYIHPNYFTKTPSSNNFNIERYQTIILNMSYIGQLVSMGSNFNTHEVPNSVRSSRPTDPWPWGSTHRYWFYQRMSVNYYCNATYSAHTPYMVYQYIYIYL